MIIVRSPLRISLGGGGTDLPSYYEHFGGFLISAAIDKYVYVSVNRPFIPGILLKYSNLESCQFVEEIQHPIIRESLRILNLNTPQIEITTVADIPSGTGLGSSGSFATSLLKALFTHYRRSLQPEELAELACKIELEILNEPIGKQDQYISALGGITQFEFCNDGKVNHAPLAISLETQHRLEDNLLLFYTGVSRSASSILRDQDDKSRESQSDMLENLHETKEIGLRSRTALLQGDLRAFAELMHEHWLIKRKRTKSISSDFINSAYESSLTRGAIGGKLVGAGGGGFLLLYAGDKQLLRQHMNSLGLEEVRFRFDFEGTKVVLS